MIYVTNGNNVEPLTKISNFEMQEELNSDFTINLVSYPNNNPAYNILQEESVITVGDYDFRVKQLKETRTNKQVVALNTFFDLVDIRQNDIYGGTRTFDEFATFIFSSTGWTFTSDVAGSKLIENFGENNVIALVNALCQVYECEYKILPNNRVHFSKQIGRDIDFQYRYGYNVKALSKNIDTTKLKTYIQGYGADNLYVAYTSPTESVFGKREADPIYDDRYTNADSLVDYLKSQIIDYPEVTFEMDSVELLDRELGERVWLIYEPLNLEFQTRILSQTKKFVDGKLTTIKVVLGNTIPRTTTDILISQKVEIDENKKITRSKFEQTNDRITLEVDELNSSISRIELKADSIELSVNNRITNEVASLNLRADGIQAEVNRNGQDIARVDIKADSISSTVTSQGNQINGLDGRVGNAESSIIQQANEISQKVSQTDYNGNTIASLINQTATTVTIQASKIELRGAVRVLSDISDELGTITAGNIYGTNIYSANIDISEDVTVGSTINLGSSFTGTYNINFGGDAGASRIQYSGDQITLQAIGGVSIPEGLLFVEGNPVMLTNQPDLMLAWNGQTGATGRIYLRQYGTDKGYIQLQ